MSHYNIAVTVGANIFRPKELTPADFVNAGTFYDIFIRFMENFEDIFGAYTVYDPVALRSTGAGEEMLAMCMDEN